MSTMGMQVELSMTAKGVQATLKDAQGAIVQTASIVKTQLGGATDHAGQGLMKLKEGLGRSRETMMFFTRSLAELGPGGQMAQTALSGLGGMLMGGGVVGLGLAVAQIGTELLADALGKEAKAAEEAKKHNDQVFAKLTSDAEAAAKAVQAFNAKARGVDANDAELAANAAAMTPHIAKAKAEMEAKGKVLADLQAEQDAGRAYAGQQLEIDAAAEQVRLAEKTYDDLVSKQEAFEARRKQVATTSAIEIENANQAANDAAQKAATDATKAPADKKFQIAQKLGQDLWQLEVERAARETELERQREAAGQAEWAAAWKLQEEEAARLSAMESQQAAATKAMAQANTQAIMSVAEASGAAFADMILGSKSLAGAMATMAKSVVNTVIDMVKTQIMADAVASAAAAFKSQAGIPVVGPMLGAAAMIAALTAVQGLVSAVPARAMGGSVELGQPYLVGERGPELFVPGAGGTISPNGAFGGGAVHLTVNAVDSQGFRRLLLDNGPALAEAIGRAARDGRRFG